MKRSDMVTLMLKIEREMMYYQDSRAFMSDLLKGIEKAGMLPPDSLPNALAIGEKQSYFADKVLKRYKWEAEDEQN